MAYAYRIANSLSAAFSNNDGDAAHTCFHNIILYNRHVRDNDFRWGLKLIEVQQDNVFNTRIAFVNRDTSLDDYFINCNNSFNSESYNILFGNSELPKGVLDYMPVFMEAFCNANGCV